MSYYPGILPPPPLPAAAAVLQGGLTRNLYSDLESSPNPGGGILRAWDLLGLSFGVIPGASSPSWRKPSWGGGIPGSVSEGESGLGQSSPSPSSWLRAQAGFVSFAYICIYASFTCAPGRAPRKSPVQGHPRETRVAGCRLEHPNLEILVRGPSPIQCLNLVSVLPKRALNA